MTALYALTASEATRQHPLATKQGIYAFAQALEAYGVWRTCTRCQRDVLRGLREPLRAALKAAGDQPVQLPSLPESTHPRTLSGLIDKGLVADGCLTPLGGLVVYWCAREAA